MAGFFERIFRGTPEPEPLPSVPVDQLVLSNLQPGWLVDFDDQSWQVMDRVRVEFADGTADEWVLRSPAAEVRLQRETRFGQEGYEMLVRIPVEALGDDVRRAVVYDGDPPAEAWLGDLPLALDPGKRGGHYRRSGGAGAREGFIAWTYRDEAGDPAARVEQLSDTEVRAYTVTPVAEYQFTSVLPGTLS